MNQPLLRITQTAQTDGQIEVEVSFELPGHPRQTAKSEFDFALAPHDQRDLRWYLEDYIQHPHAPAPSIAERIEERMAEMGRQLFNGVFGSGDAFKLWARFQEHAPQSRVEIATEVREATAVPWELMRDPDTGVPLALTAQSFVRTQSNPARPALAPGLADSGEAVRILLVICRPAAGNDVAFRSVASRIVKSLGEKERAAFQLDVLRPPTFAELGRALRRAQADGHPYHAVHFDGHGDYIEEKETHPLAGILKHLNALLFGGLRKGSHGYLAFETQGLGQKIELVDGPAMGRLLAETGVPLLLLNACRSAYAESPATPEEVGDKDPHAEVRAYGSLAQEVMDQGVVGVVAMRYSVYVVTAAQFVADLYSALVRGQALGEAVSFGRKQLETSPLRDVGYGPTRLLDWSVPIVYEAAPLALFPPAADEEKKTLAIRIRADDAAPERGDAIDLPAPPDAGFWGRDETILALDRAFDSQRVVLLHAFAGSGKTAVVCEFARWYGLTGGIEGPVFFTSFERYLPLPRVLDLVGRVFGGMLEQSGVHWLALNNATRREVALQVLRQVPVLWIWDNVEPVAGFPSGTPSAWKSEEQKELVDFLRDAANGTKAKFLLTSRRPEKKWLSDLPARIALPPMPMQERIELARAIAAKHNATLSAIDDWRPLLRFSGGNPLTLTSVVGQALRDGLKARDQIEAFVEKLRAGEDAFDDEAEEGRSKSLGASLSYGFENAFDEADRRRLALLHLFQGFVAVDALCLMGNLKKKTGEDHSLPAVRGLTREEGIALLDRAAETGLLTAHGGGYYSIHPVLPWFFRSLFDHYYPEANAVPASKGVPATSPNDRFSALRAFVVAIGGLVGDYYGNQYVQGNREVITSLKAEEANLLHARRLARTHGWWILVIGTMQGLRWLYDQTGRRSEWKDLVDEIVPEFVDRTTGGPLPGREEAWSLVTEYRAQLAMDARQWTEVERLQRIHVEWDRRRAAPALDTAPDALDDAGRNAVRTQAVSIHELGRIQCEQGKSDCVASYEESIGLCQRVEDRPGEAVAAFNLGHAYMQLPALRDLAKAEEWYRRSLSLRNERDRLGRGECIGQLGAVVYERFKEARAARRPEEELLTLINAAAQFYHHALDLFPEDAVNRLAVTHNMLGSIYGEAGSVDRALQHFRESIRYKEMQGDLYHAARTRFNIAITLASAGRFDDALVYAKEALRNFKTFGDSAAYDIQNTQCLIAKIQDDLAKQPGR